MYNHNDPYYRRKVWRNWRERLIVGAATLFAIWLLATLTGRAQTLKHEVLKEDAAGTTTNYHFLVEGLERDKEQIRSAAASLVSQYCSDKTCNQVYFYSDRKAYELLMYSRDRLNVGVFDGNVKKWTMANETWKRQNWEFLCEHIVAIYSGYQANDLEYDPYMDDEYRKYGGELKRLQPTVVQLNSVATPEEKKEDGSIGGLFVGLALIGGLYYYIRKRQKAAPTK